MADADFLLEKMRHSKYGWRYNDLVSLYVAFGFEWREGGKHTIFYHPVHGHLRATVTRSRTLAVGYIQTALKLIDQLKAVEAVKKGR